MLNAKALTSQDLQGLSYGAISELAASLLVQLTDQDAQLSAKAAQLEQAATQIAQRDAAITQRDAAIKFKDVKIEEGEMFMLPGSSLSLSLLYLALCARIDLLSDEMSSRKHTTQPLPIR